MPSIVLIKNTLSAIPTHTALAVNLSPWVIKCIDGYRRGFLWQGASTAKGGHCLLSWPRVCRPTDFGGLGLLDLQRFGYALRMRWLWLKRAEGNRSWQDLPTKEEPIVQAMFQESIYFELGDGNMALFWSDRWLQGQSLLDVAPCLCNAVDTRVRKRRTVAHALQNNCWISDISGALTVQVLIEYLRVWDLTHDIHLLTGHRDKLCWKWTAEKIFSTSSAYSAFFHWSASDRKSKTTP